jgi:hypothetical protein
VIATPELIGALSTDLAPVRRLRSPFLRAAGWLLLAALIFALLAIAQGIRPDLAERLQDARFVLRITAALLTGVLATVAAFLLSLPDRSRLWLLLPALTLVPWLSTIGYQCLTDWISVDPAGLSFGETARCFATLVLMSLPLSFAMLVMLRHAALLRPRTVAFAGSLAIAAITSAALSLIHGLDATMMILVWNIGTAALLVGFGGAFGQKMFSWVAPRLGLREP